MSGYTPGPWEVDEDSLRGSSYVAIHGDGWVEFASVVTRMKDGKESPEGRANARLIAAAPDLLEALDALVNMPSDMTAERVAALDAARKALTKARG